MPALQRSAHFRSVNSIYSRTKLFLPCISRIFEGAFQLMGESLRLVLLEAAFRVSFSTYCPATAQYRKVSGTNAKRSNIGTPLTWKRACSFVSQDLGGAISCS